jgi:hypothetical protein
MTKATSLRSIPQDQRGKATAAAKSTDSNCSLIRNEHPGRGSVTSTGDLKLVMKLPLQQYADQTTANCVSVSDPVTWTGSEDSPDAHTATLPGNVLVAGSGRISGDATSRSTEPEWPPTRWPAPARNWNVMGRPTETVSS